MWNSTSKPGLTLLPNIIQNWKIVMMWNEWPWISASHLCTKKKKTQQIQLTLSPGNTAPASDRGNDIWFQSAVTAATSPIFFLQCNNVVSFMVSSSSLSFLGSLLFFLFSFFCFLFLFFFGVFYLLFLLFTFILCLVPFTFLLV
jgi:hypothetical protein